MAESLHILLGTSACLQWLCHSGERTVARGPLVLKRESGTPDFKILVRTLDSYSGNKQNDFWWQIFGLTAAGNRFASKHSVHLQILQCSYEVTFLQSESMMTCFKMHRSR